MRNFIQKGENLTIPAPEAVTSGGVVIAGEIIGIAAGNAAVGMPVDVVTSGVFSLPKIAADGVTLGAPVYWDVSEELATTVATENTKIGVAVAASSVGAAAVHVRLSAF